MRYKHIKRGTFYNVISDGEYRLTTFSEEGTTHTFLIGASLIEAELQFSGEGKYGGPVTIYHAEADGKYWMRPCYEFHNGRFEKC